MSADRPTGLVQIVSPHLDDAPLSLGGSIERWIAEGHDVVVVNVFSRSGFTPHAADVRSGFRNLEQVTELRKSEEAAAQADLGYRAEFLDLLDIALRGRRGSLYALVRYGRLPALPGRFERELEALLLSHLDTASPIFFPLGCGDWKHKDHLLLADLGTRLLSQGLDVRLYEDLPYARRDPDLRSSLPTDRPMRPEIRAIDLDRKLAVLGHYASQLTDDMIADVESHSIDVGGGTPAERHWVPAS